MIAKKPKNEENLDISSRLSVSKKVSGDLSNSLQLLIERFMTCIKTLDTSEVEEVEYVNTLIGRLNDLIDFMSVKQNNSYSRLDYVKLTDDYGNVATEYKLWVVGEFYIDNDVASYYKRRIVRARTPKEAIYKYKLVDNTATSSLICFGEKDMESDYSLNIENEEIID